MPSLVRSSFDRLLLVVRTKPSGDVFPLVCDAAEAWSSDLDPDDDPELLS